MSISTYYQAMPEQSTLLRRLRTEKPISTLFYTQFAYSYGIFHILDLDGGERDEILDQMVEYNGLFSSKAEVEQCLNELCEELKRANTSDPGLIWRNLYLENSQPIIQKQLARELKKRQLENYLDYVEKLLYGNQNQKLAPEVFAENDYEQLLLVPSLEVQAGTQMLREIGGEIVFEVAGEPSLYYLERFQYWREFYLEAAERGEAVVIRVL